MKALKIAKTSTDSNPSNNKLTGLIVRAIGAFFLLMSVSLFVQVIPLIYVFTGAYLSIPTDAEIGDMDTMVWLLTCVTIMLIAVYGFIQWMKWLWNRFIINPKPLFKRNEKHA